MECGTNVEMKCGMKCGMKYGMECGIGLSDFTDLKEGDVIETYDEREIPIA